MYIARLEIARLEIAQPSCPDLWRLQISTKTQCIGRHPLWKNLLWNLVNINYYYFRVTLLKGWEVRITFLNPLLNIIATFLWKMLIFYIWIHTISFLLVFAKPLGKNTIKCHKIDPFLRTLLCFIIIISLLWLCEILV